MPAIVHVTDPLMPDLPTLFGVMTALNVAIWPLTIVACFGVIVIIVVVPVPPAKAGVAAHTPVTTMARQCRPQQILHNSPPLVISARRSHRTPLSGNAVIFVRTGPGVNYRLQRAPRRVRPEVSARSNSQVTEVRGAKLPHSDPDRDAAILLWSTAG